MSDADGFLLVFGILLPLALLHVVFAATLVAFCIIVLLLVYYRIYKAHMIKTHPDKLLLEEIRRQH